MSAIISWLSIIVGRYYYCELPVPGLFFARVDEQYDQKIKKNKNIMLYVKFYMEINYFQIEKEFSLKRGYEVIQSQVSELISFKLQKKGKLV